MAVSAVKPWNSRYAEPTKESKQEVHPTYDTQEQIDECTQCPFRICINCHDRQTNAKYPRRREAMMLMQNGASPTECAKKLGLSVRTTRNWWKYLMSGDEDG